MMRSLRPSRTSGRLSETSSNTHEVGGSISTQSFDQPLSLIDQNGNNTGIQKNIIN